MRAAERGAVLEVLPDVLTYRRMHQNNRSRRMASASRKEYLQLLKNSLDQRRRLGKGFPQYHFPQSGGSGTPKRNSI